MAPTRIEKASDDLQQKLEMGPFRAIFSIGGMTCAACTNAIMHVVSPIEGVSDVAVNLVGKSATVIVASRDLVPAVVEAIEDASFDCDLVTFDPLTPAYSGDKTQVGPRTVSLAIEGMFSQSVIASHIM